MGRTKIQWTDYSLNFIKARNIKTGAVGWHCEHVSSGCVNCYAESMNLRLGTGLSFKPGHRREIELFLDPDALTEPLRWAVPGMCFVCSMTDLFAYFVEFDWIVEAFAVMAAAPQHIFQILTKRPGRAWFLLQDPRFELLVQERAKAYGFSGGWRWPLANVWLGTSIEDQETANDRGSVLFAIPAAVRFFSYEPALEHVWLHKIPNLMRPDARLGEILHQVIIGGESGPRARLFHPGHGVSMIGQCRAAGIAPYVKQLGRNPVGLQLKATKGDDMDEWPEVLRVRELPS